MVSLISSADEPVCIRAFERIGVIERLRGRCQSISSRVTVSCQSSDRSCRSLSPCHERLPQRPRFSYQAFLLPESPCSSPAIGCSGLGLQGYQTTRHTRTGGLTNGP